MPRTQTIREIVLRAHRFINAQVSAKSASSPPETVVGQTEHDKPSYERDGKIIYLPEGWDNKDHLTIAYALGEELTHHIHYEERPDLVARKAECVALKEAEEARDLWGSGWWEYVVFQNYIEAVGALGGLIVAEDITSRSQVVRSMLKPRADLRKMIDTATRIGSDLRAGRTPGVTIDERELTHLFGAQIALKAYDGGWEFKELFWLPTDQWKDYAASKGVLIPANISKL